MRRGGRIESLMRRWLFNIAAGLSLLLLVATCVMWVRSYWVQTSMWIGSKNAVGQFISLDCNVSSSSGSLWISKYAWPFGGSTEFVERKSNTPQSTDMFADYPKVVVDLPGLKINTTTSGSSHYRVRSSFWLAALVCALTPATWLVTFKWRRSRRRIARGLCGACGYDTRGSEGACPECGGR